MVSFHKMYLRSSFINNMQAAISRTETVLPTKLHGAKSNRKNVFDVHVELIEINWTEHLFLKEVKNEMFGNSFYRHSMTKSTV